MAEGLKPCGMINQGMTCYLNSVLQTLFMTNKFRDHVLRLSTGTCTEENRLLADLFRSLLCEQTAVSTEKITKVLNITNVFEQQDAAEYLQMVLHKLPEPSEIFKGIMVTSTMCSACKESNEEETDFLSIPLSTHGTQQCDVKHALDEYVGIHEMSGADQLYCVKCNKMRDMEMSNDIKQWPDILTLHLKRFEMCYIGKELHYRKNECNIKIPPILQLGSIMYPTSADYELYAIIYHYGSFISGHYVSLVKDLSGNWYHFNDDRVTEMLYINHQWITDSSKHAYLLMYRKVTDTLKLRLKEEFQYLKEDMSPRQKQLLNDVLIEPHITEEPGYPISDKREIMCNNIFEGQNIRTVLLKGDAGIGKTVTVQKFILDWAEEKSNHDIKYIFPIPFQRLNIIRQECSFMKLLQQCFENTEHMELHSDKIMLIFDGLNEFKLTLNFQTTREIKDLHKRASVSDLLTNLIMGNLLPNAQILITSRPTAANQIPAEYIHRVTEIQGFDDQQKEEYFRKSIREERMSSEVIRHIKTSRRINSMCYLPDYCRIIAAIPEEMFKTERDDFPKTLTQMYSRLLLAQIKRYRERKDNIIALGKIAFHLLVNGNSLFCHEDLKKWVIRNKSVLINSLIIKKTEDNSKLKLFCFMNHRTQEFLAALYVTEVINGGKSHQLRDLSSLKLESGEICFTQYCLLQNVMESALQKQMDLFFCFLLGMTLESSQVDLTELLTQRRSRSSSSQDTVQLIKTMIMNSSPENLNKCSLLVDALKELEEHCEIKEMKTHLKSGLSPVQFSDLMLQLLKSEEKLDDPNTQRSGVTKVQNTDRQQITDRKNNQQLQNPEPDAKRPDATSTKIYPENRTQRHASEMLKVRLKEEFQYMNEGMSPEQKQLLNDVLIEPRITVEPGYPISDKREIMCNKIFGGQNIRTVLVKGDAGIGKTVTVQKFILDWAEEKSNHDIKYIFPIPFQRLNIIRQECSFMELLQQCFENTEHMKLDSDKIMLIFDGLNEFKLTLNFQTTREIKDLHKRASVSDLLTNLIMGNLLPNAQILITSRPTAANQIPDKYIHRVTEIQGFDDQQKEEYFRKSISEESMSSKVIRHIKRSTRINSMCYLPDYCRIIAAIPEEMFKTERDDFPKTLTQMYSRLLLAQIKRNRERKDNIIALGKMASNLLVNGNSLFCHEDLKKWGIRDESVLINSLIIKKTEDNSKLKLFCFMNHRTQEFLAALYVTEVINGGKSHQLRDLSSLKLESGEICFTQYCLLQNVMESALQKQMDRFFCFLLGMTLESSQVDLTELLTQRRSRSSSSQDTVQLIKTMIKNSSPENLNKCSLLFDALKELKEHCEIKEMKTHLKSGLSPVQISDLMLQLLKSEEKLDDPNTQRSGVTKVHNTDSQRITDR
ncbi:hypothetical protein QQF64_018730, partial [Cirrhinus molitorella]